MGAGTVHALECVGCAIVVCIQLVCLSVWWCAWAVGVWQDNPESWPSFRFPDKFWPRALASFVANEPLICGRFDFCFSKGAIKCFEYNADSAAVLMECGTVQGKWSAAVGLAEVGVDAGAPLEGRVVAAWKALGLPAGTVVHFLHDVDDEEVYHSQYMIRCAQAVGLVCKRVVDVQGLAFNAAGQVVDADGLRITHIWKTWNYETLLARWAQAGCVLRTSGEVRLIDVCLREDIHVNEPIWSAIPANKV